MKIKELIKNLNQYDDDVEVLLDDMVLDALLDIKDIELIQTYDKDFVILNVDYGEREILLDE